MFDEVTGSHQANTNPTEIASTADLRSALGVGATGEAAARAVIGRMMKKRIKVKRSAARPASNGGGGGRGGGGGGAVAPGIDGLGFRGKQGRSRTGGNKGRPGRGGGRGGRGRGRGARGYTAAAAVAVKGPGPLEAAVAKVAKGKPGSGTGAGFLEEGMFKTVLSSLAKKRLRAGLLEIKTNPTDVLRCGFVEIEPARYGSTALGCHLIRGWAEQKAGNKRRVS